MCHFFKNIYSLEIFYLLSILSSGSTRDFLRKPSFAFNFHLAQFFDVVLLVSFEKLGSGLFAH